MAEITIFNEEENKSYTMTVTLNRKSLKVSGTAVGASEYYLLITTDMLMGDGTAFPNFIVKNLTDVAPGASSPASDFSALMDGYVDYFVSNSSLIYSSSSSSSSFGNSSSSSSSELYSSSSSSSSSELFSSSSSSSSSELYSSSSSSSSSSGI